MNKLSITFGIISISCLMVGMLVLIIGTAKYNVTLNKSEDFLPLACVLCVTGLVCGVSFVILGRKGL